MRPPNFKYVFDYHPGDIYWCTADVGWVTGHSYPPVRSAGLRRDDADVLKAYRTGQPRRVCARWLISIRSAFSIPRHTAIRALMAEGDKAIEGTDRSSLRILAPWANQLTPKPGVVLEEDRQREVPGDGYQVANRNRRLHDHPAAGAPLS